GRAPLQSQPGALCPRELRARFPGSALQPHGASSRPQRPRAKRRSRPARWSPPYGRLPRLANSSMTTMIGQPGLTRQPWTAYHGWHRQSGTGKRANAPDVLDREAPRAMTITDAQYRILAEAAARSASTIVRGEHASERTLRSMAKRRIGTLVYQQ